MPAGTPRPAPWPGRVVSPSELASSPTLVAVPTPSTLHEDPASRVPNRRRGRCLRADPPPVPRRSAPAGQLATGGIRPGPWSRIRGRLRSSTQTPPSPSPGGCTCPPTRPPPSRCPCWSSTTVPSTQTSHNCCAIVSTLALTEPDLRCRVLLLRADRPRPQLLRLARLRPGPRHPDAAQGDRGRRHVRAARGDGREPRRTGDAARGDQLPRDVRRGVQPVRILLPAAHRRHGARLSPLRPDRALRRRPRPRSPPPGRPARRDDLRHRRGEPGQQPVAGAATHPAGRARGARGESRRAQLHGLARLPRSRPAPPVARGVGPDGHPCLPETPDCAHAARRVAGVVPQHRDVGPRHGLRPLGRAGALLPLRGRQRPRPGGSTA